MKNKKKIVAYLTCFALLGLLFTACTEPMEENKISIHPYEDTPMLTTLYMDYYTTTVMQELWDSSDLVVIGRYINEAPRSYNISRDLNDHSKPSSTSYYENLVYQFEVAAVLKGNETASVIEVGQFHGRVDGEYAIAVDTFVEPDLNSYKVLFLSVDEYVDHYSFEQVSWWLSTALIDDVSEDWESMTFMPQGRGMQPGDPQWEDEVERQGINLNMQPVNTATAKLNQSCTSYTGAELLAIAESANE